MFDAKTCFTVTALVAQWLMAVLTMALFLDPNLCALFSAIRLFVNGDLALHRMKDEQKWSAYQSEIVRAYETVLSDIGCSREQNP